MLTAIDQFLLVLDNGRCQHGISPPRWCDIFDKDLFDLDEIAGDIPDLAKRHNTSICMDCAVAKSLLNATCLEAPITPPILVPVFAVFGCGLILLIVAASACYLRRRQRRRNHGRVPTSIELDQRLY